MKTNNGFDITTHSFIQKTKKDGGNLTTGMFKNLNLIRTLTYNDFLTIISNLSAKENLTASYSKHTDGHPDIMHYEFSFDRTLGCGEVLNILAYESGMHDILVIDHGMCVAHFNEICEDDIKFLKNILGTK